eukprot:COSAG01_NODE_6884_length_3448_cov_15.327566_5_plen_91_part_00
MRGAAAHGGGRGFSRQGRGRRGGAPWCLRPVPGVVPRLARPLLAAGGVWATGWQKKVYGCVHVPRSKYIHARAVKGGMRLYTDNQPPRPL